ncbi:hypothetical protein [Actinomadura atramentaria]|uniref:hypothetical protein n=1 Tax=Actinomadura atramentaria TaxID=1990 RepID=UPI0003731C5B|nr:hypothetical protein [Actinomadura atramentaria]
MDASGAAARAGRALRHGPSGLLVALLVVAGLVFSYGLGHAPPQEVCTAHSLHVPAGSPLVHGVGTASPGPLISLTDLPARAPVSPADACCLVLPVLFGLLAFALAALPRRAGGRAAARGGWALAPPRPFAPAPRSLAALQVLRL